MLNLDVTALSAPNVQRTPPTDFAGFLPRIADNALSATDVQVYS